jgi:hypothetical protein
MDMSDSNLPVNDRIARAIGAMEPVPEATEFVRVLDATMRVLDATERQSENAHRWEDRLKAMNPEGRT